MKLGDFLARQIADRLGIPVRIEHRDSTWSVAIEDVEVNASFTIEFRRAWRSAQAVLVWGTFARPCIQKLGEAAPINRASVAALASVLPKGVRTEFIVNGIERSLTEPEAWPTKWTTVQWSLLKRNLPGDDMKAADWEQVASDLVVPLLAMLVSLLGVEEVHCDTSVVEGSARESHSLRYERKKINREICLQIRGARCLCCELSMGDKYGKFASNLIEVHHVVPASVMGPNYRVNPLIDLIPVCPNCHRVLHLSDPPMPPEKLRSILRFDLNHFP